MLRRTNWFTSLGIVLLLLGVGLYLRGSSQNISLLYWLGGPLLWFAGFAVLIGSVAERWFSSAKKNDHSSATGPKLLRRISDREPRLRRRISDAEQRRES